MNKINKEELIFTILVVILIIVLTVSVIGFHRSYNADIRKIECLKSHAINFCEDKNETVKTITDYGFSFVQIQN